MLGFKYIKILVEEIHSTTVATIGADGHPQTRVIDMMHYDEEGVYFLTAKGKAFYDQLIEQGYIAVSATKDKKAVSLRGLRGACPNRPETLSALRQMCQKLSETVY